MKKLVIFMVVFAILLLAGCAALPQTGTEPSIVPTVSTQPTQPTQPSAPALPEYQPGSIQLEPRESDDYHFLRKYRVAYYRIWGEYMDLLDDEQREDLYDWLEEDSKNTNYGEFREEMLLVSFVKRYNITREDFDAATAKFTENSKDYINAEEYEVPNGDIIYTFDNEIINYYYRYE